MWCSDPPPPPSLPLRHYCLSIHQPYIPSTNTARQNPPFTPPYLCCKWPPFVNMSTNVALAFLLYRCWEVIRMSSPHGWWKNFPWLPNVHKSSRCRTFQEGYITTMTMRTWRYWKSISLPPCCYRLFYHESITLIHCFSMAQSTHTRSRTNSSLFSPLLSAYDYRTTLHVSCLSLSLWPIHPSLVVQANVYETRTSLRVSHVLDAR